MLSIQIYKRLDNDGMTGTVQKWKLTVVELRFSATLGNKDQIHHILYSNNALKCETAEAGTTRDSLQMYFSQLNNELVEYLKDDSQTQHGQRSCMVNIWLKQKRIQFTVWIGKHSKYVAIRTRLTQWNTISLSLQYLIFLLAPINPFFVRIFPKFHPSTVTCCLKGQAWNV